VEKENAIHPVNVLAKRHYSYQSLLQGKCFFDYPSEEAANL
jgi:hypothetical protein